MLKGYSIKCIVLSVSKIIGVFYISVYADLVQEQDKLLLLK